MNIVGSNLQQKICRPEDDHYFSVTVENDFECKPIIL